MCDEDILKINYPNGHMIIYLRGVFPKSKKQFNKFIKFIKSLPENEDIKQKLKVYFQKQININEDEFILCAKVYFHYMQLYIETKNQIENKKYSNGVYIQNNDLKEMKIDMNIYKSIYKSYEKHAKGIKKKTDNFKYFLKVVNEDVL